MLRKKNYKKRGILTPDETIKTSANSRVYLTPSSILMNGDIFHFITDSPFAPEPRLLFGPQQLCQSLRHLHISPEIASIAARQILN